MVGLFNFYEYYITVIVCLLINKTNSKIMGAEAEHEPNPE